MRHRRGALVPVIWLAIALSGIVLVTAPQAAATPAPNVDRSEASTDPSAPGAGPTDAARTAGAEPKADNVERVDRTERDRTPSLDADRPKKKPKRSIEAQRPQRHVAAGGEVAGNGPAAEDGSDTGTADPVVSGRSAETGDPAPVAVTPEPIADDGVQAVAPNRTRSPSLVNLIGSVVMNVLIGAIHLADGPPVLPPGSTVTVRTARLDVPVAGGRNVEADWYFPENADRSTRLVYLQHGFMASGPMYSYTAARIAERTNSIVVAPSLSSNFFDPAAAWVGGAPMQQAMAELFVGDRRALVQSASTAAGFPVALPQQFAFVGHSAGGTLVTAAAGYLARRDALDDLVGVVLLDGVEPAKSRAVTDALTALTGDHQRPVYLISSQRYFWSRGGDMADKLQAARPGVFNGVALTGGWHSDYLQGGNALIQWAQYAITGFSADRNVYAATDISVGWINDLFAGAKSEGIYGAPGQAFPIDTPAGTATATVLPLAAAQRTPLQRLVDGFFTLIFDWAGRHVFVYEPMS